MSQQAGELASIRAFSPANLRAWRWWRLGPGAELVAYLTDEHRELLNRTFGQDRTNPRLGTTSGRAERHALYLWLAHMPLAERLPNLLVYLLRLEGNPDAAGLSLRLTAAELRGAS